MLERSNGGASAVSGQLASRCGARLQGRLGKFVILTGT